MQCVSGAEIWLSVMRNLYKGSDAAHPGLSWLSASTQGIDRTETACQGDKLSRLEVRLEATTR